MKAGHIRNSFTLIAIGLISSASSSGPYFSEIPEENTVKPPYELPGYYDPRDTPWISGFDAQSIAEHYARKGDTSFVTIAWPWLNTFCAPTFYPRWEALPDEIKLASVDRQKLCNMVVAASTTRDLQQMREQARKNIQFAHDIWGKGSVEHGKYLMTLGLTHEELPFVAKEGAYQINTPQAAMLWLSRRMSRLNYSSPSIWMTGKTVGPYTPVSRWTQSWQISSTEGVSTEQEAIDTLNNMAAKRGLLGLRLPLGWASTPTGWIEAARRIDRVAGLIEKRSRMTNGGFGLWGKTLFDWRSPEKSELQALTIRYGDFFLVQAQQGSMAHEWFHTFQHWSRANGYAHHHDQLMEDIAKIRYTKAQIRTIFEQSHKVLAKHNAAKAWVQTLYGQDSENIWQYQPNNPDLARDKYWYAQAAWTLSPRLDPGENHWIARRRTLEETMKSSGWKGAGVVQPGYYTLSYELTASAFQGDINLLMRNDGLIENALPDNLISVPLPVESIAMVKPFSRLFAEIKKQRREAAKKEAVKI